MVVASGSNTLSQEIYTSLVSDLNLTLPALPSLSGPEFTQPTTTGNELYGNISKIANADLTTAVVGGTGIFDVLMTAMKAHLAQEHQAGRITGDQYTKAYIATTTQALEIGTQFLLNREQTYWQSLLVQTQAQRGEVERVMARVQLEIAKASLYQAHAQAKVQNQLSAAQYALAKMNLSIADKDFLIKGVQKLIADQDEKLRIEQVNGAGYNNTHILPAQKKLLEEQVEVQRAQTLNTRTDGQSVAGAVGKQKDLYTQQIDSYKKSDQYKVAKIVTDAWITRKTLDEGAPIPTALTDANLNQLMNVLRSTNGMN